MTVVFDGLHRLSTGPGQVAGVQQQVRLRVAPHAHAAVCARVPAQAVLSGPQEWNVKPVSRDITDPELRFSV
jgi:hypothetical protein